MPDYDIVIVGGGHNGLTVGAYHAKAGLSVCVLEQQDFIGGACSTRELTLPGFRHDVCGTAHGYIQANPIVTQDELGLFAKYGLEYIHPQASFACAFEDETSLVFHLDMDRTCESIAQYSPADADAYRRLVRKAKPLVAMMMGQMHLPAPPVGLLMSQLDQSPAGREMIRMMSMSAWDLIQQTFRHEKVRTAVYKICSEPLALPEEKGTGVMFLLSMAISQVHPSAYLKGGSGRLSEALAAYVRDQGGTIRTSAPVRQILASAGTATGVVLADGEPVMARKAVVCAIDPRLVFPAMIAAVPDDDFLERLGNIENCGFAGMMVHAAINEPLKWRAGDEMNIALCQEPLGTLDDIRDEFEALRRKRLLQRRQIAPSVFCQTLHDPSRAPAGKHLLYLYQYQPYAPDGRSADVWDEIRAEQEQHVLDSLQRWCTNATADNILATRSYTPRDFERKNPNLICGSVAGPAMASHQMFSYRPIPELGGYRTHIANLYFCGAAFHPGGGLSCGGRATAQVMMDDWGMSIEDVVAR